MTENELQTGQARRLPGGRLSRDDLKKFEVPQRSVKEQPRGSRHDQRRAKNSVTQASARICTRAAASPPRRGKPAEPSEPRRGGRHKRCRSRPPPTATNRKVHGRPSTRTSHRVRTQEIGRAASPVPVLMERIGRRGRDYESGMDPDYLERLSEAYSYYFFHYRETPLLVVNTDEIDFVNNPADFDAFVDQIVRSRRGTQVYVPVGSQRS